MRGTRILALALATVLVAILFAACSDDDGPGPSANQPPSAPELDVSSGAPADDATGVARATTLAWTCSDPDDFEDALIYDVLLGPDLPPSVVANSLANTSFGAGLLDANTQYYWQIIAIDPKGARTSSPVWAFTTAASVALCVSPTVWSAPASGGQKLLQISDCGGSSGFAFSASSGASWCTINPTQGIVPNSVTVTASNNTTGFSRTSAVTITASGISGSPRQLEVTQVSSVSATIVVRNAWTYPISARVDGTQYDIGPGQSRTIPMLSTTTTLCIWECPVNPCRWDCAYTVRVGQHYKVVQYGAVNDLLLQGD